MKYLWCYWLNVLAQYIENVGAVLVAEECGGREEATVGN
jgi:hypothetical protein